MPSPDIHIIISSLANLYNELNKRWNNDTCTTDVYQVYRPKEYRNVYERLKDVNMESIALKIIADSVSDKVLSRLRELIQDNASAASRRCAPPLRGQRTTDGYTPLRVYGGFAPPRNGAYPPKRWKNIKLYLIQS